MKTSITFAFTSIAVMALLPANAQFSDNFEINSSANYTITQDPDALATFAYDYSVLGIPSAPHSAGGTTLGLRLEANNGDATAAAAAISLSPTGKSFTGNFRITFDMWMNANGPFPGGGAGSTEFLTAGVGTAGNTVHKSSGTADGTWFAVDGEGGSGVDYRAYLGTVLQGTATGDYTAGSSAATDAYYTSKFPGQSAPALQQANYPQQTGTIIDGAVGFGWHTVDIDKNGNDVTWSIDGYSIATVTGATFNGDNITIGYWDPFGSISDNPTLSFGLVDNLSVSVVPEPSTCLLGALAAGLFALRRRKK